MREATEWTLICNKPSLPASQPKMLLFELVLLVHTDIWDNKNEDFHSKRLPLWEKMKKKTPKIMVVVQLCQACRIAFELFGSCISKHVLLQLLWLLVISWNGSNCCSQLLLSPFHSMGTGRSNFVSCCPVCWYCLDWYRCSLTMERRVYVMFKNSWTDR